MSSIAARLPQGRFNPVSSRLGLAALFLLFCYILLSWRAVLLTDAAPILSERRILVLLVGAGLFWSVLERLDSAQRVTLARTASWIVGATALVLTARVAVDWWMPAAELTLNYQLRWSLAWGAYFGLWVMGAITFRQRRARVAGAHTAEAFQAPAVARPAETATADLAWLMDALAPELHRLEPAARSQLADRLLDSAGHYEVADPLEANDLDHYRRLKIARRLADRLRAH